jgi:hypothetical protein
VLEAPPEDAVIVTLVDGSTLVAVGYAVIRGRAIVQLADGGELEIPTRRLQSACFGRQDDAIKQQWTEIVSTHAATDVIVIRKVVDAGGVEGSEQMSVGLDHLEGVVLDIDEQVVGFEFDGTRVDVPRRKVEGVIYARAQTSDEREPLCRVRDRFGSSWNVRSFRFLEGDFELVSSAGLVFRLPGSHWTETDFTVGNLVYLTDLQPETVRWQPYLESSATPEALLKWFQPKWDSGIHGGPLMLAGQAYERGLAVHSRTTITFRLTAGYRRFLATVGVDDRYRSHGQVRLVVSGERGTLFEQQISGTDEPFELDVDIQGVRRLRLLVDFGADRSDTGDHLNLANARLTK